MRYLYYLVGPPGSGKRTVGKALSALTGAALLDNHIINDPIFTAFGADGLKPMPPEVWPLAGRVRAAVMDAVAVAPPAMSHIFTNYLSADQGEWQTVQTLRDLALKRAAHFIPVWLECPLPELERRMLHPERRERLKMRDPDRLRQFVAEHGLLPAPPDAIQVNTAEVGAQDAALLIAMHAGAL